MNIIVCDDDDMYADSLVDVLSTSGHDVVACLSDSSEIAPIVRDRHVDACVLDVTQPSGDELQHIPALRRLAPWMRIVVLAARSQACRAIAMEAGASSFLPKACDVRDLLASLGDIDHEREHAETPGAAAPRLRTSSAPTLTVRERQVLHALVAGDSSAAIARRHGLRPATVRGHVQSLFEKLGVHSRAAAISFALRHGLVDAPGPATSQPLLVRDRAAGATRSRTRRAVDGGTTA